MSPTRNCLGCGSGLPEPFLDLGSTPLANAFVRPEMESHPDPVFRLAVAFCPACHLVQLTDPVPPRDLFSEYLYFSSYSEIFLDHARRMAASLIERFDLGASARVLEIASNDGYLLQYFRERGLSVLGVEPARNIAEVAERRGIPTLNRFFGPEIVPDIAERFGPADVIIGNNVLAHVPAINGFLRSVRECLAAGGAAVFEFPYLRDLLDKTEFDTIYHEHVFYFGLSAVSHLAERAGLHVFDVEPQPVHGGSLRVFLARPGTRPAAASVASLLEQEGRSGLLNADRYRDFSGAVSTLKQRLRERLGGLKAEGKRLAAYGAPAKGNTLLNYCGIGRDLLEFTVDRSPHKQGLLLPGSRLPVLAPEELLRRRPDWTLILPWNIAGEIVRQQREYAATGGRFLVPVPRPEEIAA